MPIGDDLVFAGDGAAVARLRLQVERMAPHFRVALLVGERGTGVEAVARRMHELCAARTASFVILDASDFAAGKQPEAAGVVLLTALDGVGIKVQSEFLRRLNLLARETRVLVASECDPRGMVSTGRLRNDLYERIGTLEIRVAPLRERLEDLPALMRCDFTFTERAMNRLMSYEWPRNLEELSELSARVGRLGRAVDVADLGLAQDVIEKVVRLDKVIERHVVNVLERVGGNKLRAAELLGISRSTLYRMLESVGA